MSSLSDFFFQIVMLLVGGIIGVIAQMLSRSSLGKLLALLSSLLIIVAIVWIAVEPGDGNDIPTTGTTQTIIQVQGDIGAGFGSMWLFSTDSSRITITLNLDKPADACPIEVWVRHDANLIFSRRISPGARNFTAVVAVEPNINYYVVVGGNDKSSTPGCSGLEYYSFDLLVTS